MTALRVLVSVGLLIQGTLGSVNPLGSTTTVQDTDTIGSFTAPAGLNRLLVVILSHDETGSSSAFSVSFNGTPLTLARSAWDGGFAYDSIWYLPLGSSGSGTTAGVSVTVPGTATGPSAFIHAAVFQNVNQGLPISSTSTNGATGGPAGLDSTLTMSSDTDDLAIDIFDSFTSTVPAPDPTASGSQTVTASVSGSFSGGLGEYRVSNKAGTVPEVTMAWTTTTATAILHVGANINAVPEVGTGWGAAAAILLVGGRRWYHGRRR